MLEQVTQRILVPPFWLAFLVGLAVVMDHPTAKRLLSCLEHFVASDNLSSVVGLLALLVGTTAVVVTSGFIIASSAIFLTHLLAFEFGLPRGLATVWSKDAMKKLREIYDFKDFKNEAEQCEKCFLSAVPPPRVLEWKKRRWELYITSSNCAVASLWAMILVCALGINPGSGWWNISTIALLIFLFNAYQAWREVQDMGNFLVRNAETISKSKPVFRTFPTE